MGLECVSETEAPRSGQVGRWPLHVSQQRVHPIVHRELGVLGDKVTSINQNELIKFTNDESAQFCNQPHDNRVKFKGLRKV